MNKHLDIRTYLKSIALLLVIILTGCNLGVTSNVTSPIKLAEAEVVFQVTLPGSIPGNSGVVLEILRDGVRVHGGCLVLRSETWDNGAGTF